MTEEEIAEGYYYKTYPVTLNIGEEERKKEVTDIFLAGLKAGKDMAETDLATVAYMQGAERYKLKWHKVADGDLPEENHFVLVLNKQTGYEIARHAPFEEYHLDNWVTVDNRSLVPIKNNPSVIAWCEIPKYTEE